jgi:DNA-directed RNA polymerase beta subunit
MNTKLDGLYDLPLPSDARGFFDPEKTRKWLHEYTLDSLTTHLNKIETPEHKLQVKDLKIVEPAEPISYKEQKQAVLEKRDITLPIKGTLQLIDKATGHVIDEKKSTIAHVPYITERNTSIINGSEYITTHQQRLKPGVYTRIKSSGAGEAEAHINVLPGTGVGGKLIFYPDKAIFVYQVGTTQIKLYGLLKDLGVSDDQMKSAWGEEIFQRNKAAHEGNELEKFYSKIFKYEE